MNFTHHISKGFQNFGGGYTSAITHTMAHELGHGVYRLQHTFDYKHAEEDKYKTDNLMDYNQGDFLAHYQWRIMQDSVMFVWKVLQEDEDGMAFREDGTKLICLSSESWNNLSLFKNYRYYYLPDGSIIDLEGCQPIRFYAEDDVTEKARGAINAFRYEGTTYELLYNSYSKIVTSFVFEVIGNNGEKIYPKSSCFKNRIIRNNFDEKKYNPVRVYVDDKNVKVKEFNKPASELLFERTPSKDDNSCRSSFSVERFNKEDLGYITNDPDPLTMISFLYSGSDKESTVVEYIQKLPKSLVVSLNSQGVIVELLKILTNSDEDMTEAKQQAILKLLYCLDINYVEDVLEVLNSKYGTGDDWVIDHLISEMGDNSEFVDLATDLYVKRYTYLENVFGHILNFNSVLNSRELFCVKLLEKLPEENYLHFIQFLQDNNSKMMRNIIEKIDDFSLFNSDRNYSEFFKELSKIYYKSNIYNIDKLVAVNLDESSVKPIQPGETPEYFYEIARFDDIENSDFLTISSWYNVNTTVEYEDESGWHTMQITLPKCITSIRVNFWDPVLITNQETLETVQKTISQVKNIEDNGLEGVLVPAVFLHYIKDKRNENLLKNAAKVTAITTAVVIGAVACPKAVLVAAVKAGLARKAAVNFAKGAAEDVVKSIIVEKISRELGLSDDAEDPSWSAVFSSKFTDVNTYKSAIISGVTESFKFDKLRITLPLSCIEGIEVDKLFEQMKKGKVNKSEHIINCALGAFFEFLGTQEGKEFLQLLKDKLGIYKFFKKYNVKYNYRIKLLELLYKNKKGDELVIIDAFFQLKVKEEGSSKYLINRNISIDKDIDVTEEIVQFVEDKTDGTKICAFSHKNGGEFSINLYKLKEIKDSYGEFKGEYEFVQFAEDMVKKLSQDKITEGLNKFIDKEVEESVKKAEDYIDGILKDLLNSKKDE